MSRFHNVPVRSAFYELPALKHGQHHRVTAHAYTARPHWAVRLIYALAGLCALVIGAYALLQP